MGFYFSFNSVFLKVHLQGLGTPKHKFSSSGLMFFLG